MVEIPAEFRDFDDYLDSVHLIAEVTAKQLTFLAKYTSLDEGEFGAAGEYSSQELATVLRVSRKFMRDRIELAHALTTRLPRTMQALREGVLDEYKAKRVMLATDVLSDDLATQVENKVVPKADECDTTKLNRRLRAAVIRADPDGAAERAEAKRAAREVRHDVLDDAAGILTIQGDGERTRLAYERLTTIARDLKSSGETRTIDQLRSDVALDCLAGKGFEHAKVRVWLTIPAATALGVDNKPGYLAGYGWLPAQRALEIAAHEDATWQRILTDPATGHVVDVGRDTYRPPAALRDHLRARYSTCAAPGCHQPSQRCDIDHVVPFPAGPTTSANTWPLCRSHHNAKTHGGWRIVSDDNGGITWVTKHGYQFPHAPEPITEPEAA